MSRQAGKQYLEVHNQMMPSPSAFKHFCSVSRENIFIYYVKHAEWETKHLYLPIHLYLLFHISFLFMSMEAVNRLDCSSGQWLNSKPQFKSTGLTTTYLGIKPSHHPLH